MQGNLKDFLKDMETVHLTDFTKDGHCSGCGSCCSNILPMSDADIKRIKEYINTHSTSENRNNPPYAAAPDFDMTCPFRDNTARKCTIYPVRPEICRLFVCNKQKDAEKNKSRLYRLNRLVFVRQTFFQSELEIHQALAEAMKVGIG